MTGAGSGPGGSAAAIAATLGLLGLVLSSPLQAACSAYIGQATINEVYRQGNEHFIEVKLLDASIPASTYNEWYVVACRNAGCTGSAAISNIGNATTSNYPWFIWDQSVLTDNQNFRLNQGLDFALYDANGDHIDYLSVNGFNNNAPACGFSYDTTATAGNAAGDIYRLADGTGDWEFLKDGVPTPAAINVTDSGDLASLGVSAATGAASTCQPLAVTVTAYDTGGNIYTDYYGTVTLTTSSAHGNWSLSGTANGGIAPAPDNDDNGQVTYQFPLDGSDQGQVILYLSNTHADDLAITAADTYDPTINATTGTISFKDNAFVIESAETGLAVGTDVAVAGQPHAFTASLVQRDRNDPSNDCAIAAGYDGTMNLRAWYGSDASHPGGALDPEIGGTLLPAAEPVAENISLDFAGGVAGFVLDTRDVGKYSLELADRVSGFAEDIAGNPLPILGGSPVVTVRPFGLGFTDVQQVGAPQRINPGATAGEGGAADGFVAAGEAFQARLGAYLWDAADDANLDGLPDVGADVTDNGLTPAYAWTTNLAAAAPFTPGTGVLGSLSGTDPTSASFASGEALIGDLSYAEVGSLTLAASAIDFLNTAGVDPTGTSEIIGRFYPHRFEPSGVDYAAACSGFTYMAQPADRLAYELEAVAVGGTVTVNYDAALGYAVGAVEHVAEDDNDGNDLSARMSNPDPATEWVQGVFGLDANDMVFSRAGGGPDGPYVNLAVGVTVNNSDGTRIAGVDLDPATATDCSADDSCTALAIATTGARFGRASVENAFGSEYLDLSVPLRAGFYAGEALGFLPNPDDACSTPLSIVLADADPADALDYNASDTCVQDSGSPGASGAGCTDVAPVAQQFTDPPLAGDFNLWLRAPGADKTGAVLIDAAVPAWLEYDWDGDGIHDNPPPTARAVFGSYRGDDRIIYWRERFE